MVRDDVILVGAGPAHLVALRRFAMWPLPGHARLTLVVPQAEEPYSGAVPAVMAGRWRREEASVDLAWVARAAGARLVLAEATGLDRARRELHLRGRPPLRWDWLSLNTGAQAALVPGAAEHALPLKPLGALLDAWEAAVRPGLRVVVAGGGAAGAEAALAARARGAEVALVAPAGALAATTPVRRALEGAGVALPEGRAARVAAGRLVLDTGGEVPFDLCLWAAGAVPPAWLAASGLARRADGWFLAEATLRAKGEARVFLAGDVAAIEGAPRPRNGVFSVRAGACLAANLRAALEGRPLAPFRPQRRHLALLQAGDAAIALWGGLALRGRWALRWKDRIDRAWVEGFRRLRPMPAPAPPAMRCEGCGAKLPASALRGALARLGGRLAGAAEDAAPLPALVGGVQSLDAFRPPTDDPWLAGRITAAHALGDLAAMGAEPRAALALVALPHAGAGVTEEELFQILHGARSLMGDALLGGHSAEAAAPLLGFAVTGDAAGHPLRRSGLRAGDALLLSKPLGTGAVLAAAMQGPGFGRFLPATLAAMGADPMPAARLLRAHGATAAADVTGFGLAGHLLEMLDAAGCAAELHPAALPALPGALEAMEAGFRSTAHAPNAEAAGGRVEGSGGLAPARLALLFDPQTSGGLLAGVPADRAASCLAALRCAGLEVALVGRAVAGPPRIILQPGRAPPRSQGDERGDGNDPDDPGKPLPAAAG